MTDTTEELVDRLIAAAKQWVDTRGQFVNETEGVDWMDLANAEAGLSSAVRAMGDDT